MELLTMRAGSSAVTICDYADINAPVKGLPQMAEYNRNYRMFMLYDEQRVYRCKSEFSPQEFIETASDVLTATKCRTARLDYYQILPIPMHWQLRSGNIWVM